ncbi:hypothetical protein Metli_1423 [Methanofollis liminatans DSM 4140]|uniref:Uncharacterized protein n=1 Tax=Methanofollis liminatans DSM 4140 TaxID=28892 RepID=J0S9Q8_9EURY|nr:hypothetical protein [Methanofollis liminatans]EJG07374.1 hypothetical protein Metli_1423 [Methanofollis liminatans DSM 4140]
MSCGLTEETLFILNILYKNRNLRSDRGYHSEKLNKLYTKKFSGRDHPSFKDAIKVLLKKGYITTIKKKEDKYYISDINKAQLALYTHGFTTLQGL